MVNLIAAAYEDGYAFVKVDNSIYAVRPPYRNKTPVTAETVERAVSYHGFSSENKPFADWGELFGYLKAQFIERRKEIGYDEPDTAQIRRLVRRAPQNVIENYLGRIENELIPNKEFRASINILTNLLRNSNVRENPSLWERCMELLERCQMSKEQQEEDHAGLINGNETVAEEFPLAVQYFGNKVFDLTRSVRAERQVLVVGAN